MSELEAGGAPAPAPPAPAPSIDVTPPPVGAAPPPVEEKKPTIDETLESTWARLQVNGAERADDGKFKSDKPPELAAQPPNAGTEPPPPVQAAPTIDPPNSWAAEARAHWPKLPPEAQEYILKREGEAHKAITSYGERVKSFEPFDRIINQYRADFDRRGMKPEQSFSALLEAQAMLDRSPVEGLINIGLTYGLDLRPLLAGQPAQVPTHDPRVGQLEQRVAMAEQKDEQRRQQQEQAQLAEVSALIETFKKDHPHFDAVEDELMGLIPVMRQRHPGLSQKELLDKAYDSATFANPTVRQRIQEDQRIADDKKRKEAADKADAEAKAKAEDAKKSARLNVKGSIAHPNPRTIDDTLEETWRRIHHG